MSNGAVDKPGIIYGCPKFVVLVHLILTRVKARTRDTGLGQGPGLGLEIQG